MGIGRRTILRVSGFFVLATVWQFAGSIRASLALPTPDGVMRMVYYLIRDGTFRRRIYASMELILLGIGC